MIAEKSRWGAAGPGRDERTMNGLKEILIERGAALVGFADLSAVDSETRQGFPQAVSLAAALDPKIIAGIQTGPTVAYSEEYDRANALLGELASLAATQLCEHGHRARAIPVTSYDGDPGYDRQRAVAAFQNKTGATLGGLGWIGKCALLVTREFGSAIRLSTVLTDAPLDTGVPVTESDCGDCDACATICPGQASVGCNWRRGMSREDIWDFQACRRGMKKISESNPNPHQLCGMCIAACPFTQAYLRREGAL